MNVLTQMSSAIVAYFRKQRYLLHSVLQIVFLGLALLLLQTSLTAAPVVKNPLAPPDTSSPQATLRSFVDNVNQAHEILMAAHEQSQQESGFFYSKSVQNQVKQGTIIFGRAIYCLNLSKVPLRLKQDTGIEGTLLLKEILDRIKLPPYSEIPNAKVAANRELSRWTIPGTQINIVKVEAGPKAGKFIFSPNTVSRLREFYKQVEELPYKADATEGFYEFYISTPASLTPSNLDQFFLNMPDWLNTRYRDQTLWQWILIFLTLVLLSNALAETIIASPKINSKGLDAGAIRLVFRLSSVTLGIVVFILGLEQVGIALAPLLTGLGIGGVALGLAARPTLENIFGGLTLFTDRSIQVGERCCFGDKDGYIKAIGLRSTRIIALNGDLISIPNSQFSNLELVNKSRRTVTLLSQTIGLRYETTSEQLRFVLVKLRSMILAHPKLLEERARVRFVKFGDYSLDVEIFVYVDTGNLLEFLGIQEDVLLRVMDIVKAAGTDFAFPSQTAYLSQDSGLDQELSRAAEAEVQIWREKGTLPFPEFSGEQSEQLRNSLDFPPKSSSNQAPSSDNGNKNH